MPTLPVTGVGDSAAPSQWSSAPNGVIQVIASANDSNFAEDTSNGGGNSLLSQGYLLNDMPSDFGSMSSLSIRLRYGWAAAFTNRAWNSLDARLMSGATVLAAADDGGTFTEVATAITNTTPVTSGVVAFPYVNPDATKAEWDDAVLELRIDSTRSAGGSSVARRVYAGEVTGVYEVAVAGNDLTETATDSVGLSDEPTVVLELAVAEADAVGVVDESSEVLGGAATVPDAVTDLAGVAGDGEVALTWSAPNDGGAAITDYIVQYRAVGVG
jgi:hypothetical protein